MKNYFKILVTTDYSKEAEKVVSYALQFAKETDSVLVFLHVFQGSPNFPQEFVELEKKDETPVEFELSRLEQFIEEVLQTEKIKQDDVKYTCRVIKGDVTYEILQAADKEKVDFIMLGTHEVGILEKTLFATHTWDAIRKTNIPVLAIPKNAVYHKIRNIVFATEYRESEIPLIKFLARFALWFDAELTVLHVTNNLFSKEFEHDLFEKFRKEVQDKIDYEKLSIRLISSNNLVSGLNDFCRNSESAWLVMSHEKTSLFMQIFNPASVTRRMTYQTETPLFAVPDGYKPDGQAEEISEEELKTHGSSANQ